MIDRPNALTSFERSEALVHLGEYFVELYAALFQPVAQDLPIDVSCEGLF